MKKIFVVLLLAGLFLSLTSNSAFAKKPIKGKIVSLNDLIIGGSGEVNKDKAKALAGKGQPIVFLVGKGKKAKVYFVYHEDGSYAGKKLAKFANNKYVGIVGKKKKVKGINIIIAEMIESMD